MSKGKKGKGIRDVSEDGVNGAFEASRTPDVRGKVVAVLGPEDVPENACVARSVREAYREGDVSKEIALIRPEGVGLLRRALGHLSPYPPGYLDVLLLPEDHNLSKKEYVVADADRLYMPVPRTWEADA